MSNRSKTRRGFKRLALASGLAMAGFLAGGCGVEGTELETTQQAATVAGSVEDMVGSGCSTAVVLGLARQISDEIGCRSPGLLVPFQATSSIVFTSSAVLPYLQSDALDDMRAVAATRTISINSAFRTVPQQYLLVRWYQQGRCGIAAAAAVGNSNHETGRAIDITDYSLSAMTNHGWAHDVPGDDPHFDHLASPDLRGEDTRAFQRLWNRNHPEDMIAEDGAYGPATEARLKMAPATGFALGADCGTPPPTGVRVAETVSIDGPDRAPPATRIHYSIALYNSGTIDWSSSTKLVVADGSSQLRDSSWVSNSVITTVGTPVASGDYVWVDFDATTPAANDYLILNEGLVLEDNGVRFGAFDIALAIIPGATTPTSGEGSEPTGGPGSGSGSGSGSGIGEVPEQWGGCSAGGHGAGGTFAFAVLALALANSRRRRR